MTEGRVSGGNRRRIQQVTVRKDGWTKTRRRLFLATLAETCNVRTATAAAGLSPHAAYTLRKRDPEFGALWQEALGIGYERLEEALLRHALASVNAIDVGEHSDEIDAAADTHEAGQEDGEKDGQADGQAGGETRGDGTDGSDDTAARPTPRPGSGLHPTMLSASQVQVALAILNRHRASVEGRRTTMRGRVRRTAEETDALLRRRIDQVARRLGATPAAPDASDASDARIATKGGGDQTDGGVGR